MLLLTCILLSVAGHKVSAAVTGRTSNGPSQQVLAGISGSGAAFPFADNVRGDAATAFRCDIPPAIAPGDDGLPSAEELFTGPEVLKKQVERHAALVRIPSVGYDDMGDVYEDSRWLVFLDLHRLLEELYPNVHARMSLTKVHRLGLVYTVDGSNPSLRPLMLTAHQDVVPVADAFTWKYPPFSAHYDGKFLWGRGASDDKNSLTALMSTLEALFAPERAWTPRRSLVLAFGFDEETSGEMGAGSIASYLEKRFGANSMVMILDEGGGLQRIGNTVFALPSVLEKGHVDVLYELRVNGGHSSTPFPHTGIGILAEIITALEAHPYEPKVIPGSAIHNTYVCKARYEPDAQPEITRLVQAGDLEKLTEALVALDRPTNFRIQTSQAVDLIFGGVKINAMPELITLGVNYRVAPHNSIDEVKARTLKLIEPTVSKYGLTLKAFGRTIPEAESTQVDMPDVVGGNGADAVQPLYTVDYNGTLIITTNQETQVAPVSPTSGPIWDVFSGTIQHSFAFDGGNVVPVGDIMTGNTDTRHYLNLTPNIYRWAPTFEGSTFNAHTVDERVDMNGQLGMIRFYYDLIRNFDASDA
ncbi:vacuolar carboxypeptidase [Niveomyces insectorum RCEF 264]|uniref:Vacuolar carboxypeptidase n=1 Tax=Niveomyces insectorum RCEF 264 TaxID=1081102 RepID=A0A167Z0J4_9HYPO|nr:vacuolar carboxypeptidase [Niveomyces insectorum RCEF 264]